MPRLREMVAKGYSIVIFPEGTRSDDCHIQRFHQGAFHLAKELGLDIVPMVLHGAGDYLPKNDYWVRRGRISLTILPRIAKEEYADLLLRKQASVTRKLIDDEYQKQKARRETPSYFKSLILYKYAYRGWDVVSKCKTLLHKLPEYEAMISRLDGEVWFINAGIGIIPLLAALSNRSCRVNAIIESIRDYQVATGTPSLPDNLQYLHAVMDNDYDIISSGATVFVIGDAEDACRFQKFNPTLIRIGDE